MLIFVNQQPFRIKVDTKAKAATMESLRCPYWQHLKEIKGDTAIQAIAKGFGVIQYEKATDLNALRYLLFNTTGFNIKIITHH